MDKLSIGDLLRFGFAGVIGYLYFYYCSPTPAAAIATATGPLGFPLALLVVGSLSYFLYRPLIYDMLIRSLLYKTSGAERQYRNYLHAHYEIPFRETGRLWRTIQRRFPTGDNSEFRNRAAGIHMTYLAGLLALLASLHCLVEHHSAKTLHLALFGSACTVAAFLNSRAAEWVEFDRLRAIPTSELDPVIAAFKSTLGVGANDGKFGVVNTSAQVPNSVVAPNTGPQPDGTAGAAPLG